MRTFILCLLALSLGLHASAQSWSSFLDGSRAITWSPGFTIPSYTVNCATQPALLAGSGNAAANTTAIQAALTSCDSAHNVVNIPAGTWYVTSIKFGTQGYQVLRGAGPSATFLIPTVGVGCSSTAGICLLASDNTYAGSAAVQPPGGTQQCLWTAGYAQGATSITLSSCGGVPPVNRQIFLDQANDGASDTGGIFLCDSQTGFGCTVENPGNYDGRIIGGVTYSQKQLTYVTGVTPLGGGSYTVTVSPGVYFTNVRSGQTPGAWWPGALQSSGIENLSIDGATMSSGAPTSYSNIVLYSCYQCWVQNVRSTNAGRAHILVYQSSSSVIHNSYFYGVLGSGSQSYAIELEDVSSSLIENNIFQQTTNPIMSGQGSGNVVGYNFSVDDIFGSSGSFYPQAAYWSHNAGNELNLYEGNNFFGVWGDDSWGSSSQTTLFRNMLIGWQAGKTQSTVPIIGRAFTRAENVVGNVLGQPSYHAHYQAYATSTTGGSGGATEATSIYSLGWVTQNGACSGGAQTYGCDTLTYYTLMRWGNWDVVNAATQWSSTEASPSSVAYVNANFTSGYFGTLAHVLPPSLYYSAAPSWWPSGKAWPVAGPDVSTGNVGTCSGTYNGAQATLSSQCTGGTLSAAWGSHVNSLPAQDCYLSVMGGPPDGSGSARNFDARSCYITTQTAPFLM